MGTSQFLFSSGWSVKSLRDTMTSWSVCESAFPPNLHLSSSSLALKSLGCHLWKKTPPETYGAKGNSLPNPGEMGLFCFSCHQPRFVQTSQAFSVDHVSTQGWEPHSPTRSKTSRIYNLPLLTAGIERIHIKYIYIYIHIYFLNNHIISKVHQPILRTWINYTHLEKTVLHKYVLFRGIDTIIKHSGLKGLSDSWWNIKRGAVDWSWQGTHGNAQWLRPNLHVLQHFDSRSLQWETSGDSLGNNPWRLEIF